mmetsp:Transcript_25180/g.22206  ORF Transcript_25180/g.22206 Transcript_25180/m.22206 type:complete len:92 (+) Transcript_25180:928-1203(+)
MSYETLITLAKRLERDMEIEINVIKTNYARKLDPIKKAIESYQKANIKHLNKELVHSEALSASPANSASGDKPGKGSGSQQQHPQQLKAQN